MGRFLVGLIVLSLISISCNKKSPSQDLPDYDIPKNKNGDNIVGDDFANKDMVFPNGVPVFVALIKLNTPALAETAQRDSNGEYIIDEQQKMTILQEQESLVEELKTISPDIKVLYRYRLVLNAIAVEAPQAVAQAISQLSVDLVEADERFSRPQVIRESEKKKVAGPLNGNNSMTFLGVDKVHQLELSDKQGQTVAIKGKGVRVGIIDSGIDYTHAMLGGPGDPAAFASLDPSAPTALFPNKKVVGGYDFVGAKYSPGTHIYQNRIPTPDENPLDQGGHGTHVAGTVGGSGNGVDTYSGAAPEAELYALKVFGDQGGGTSDTVVIAALEYALDPNGDFKLDDKLDIVNLSLGGTFGKPHSLYGQAIKNLTHGGVLAVAAAGNDGPVGSIVGAPSTADEALSVAASVDGMEKNWHFPAVKFVSSDETDYLAQAIEAAIAKPIEEVGNINGKLVYIGLADKDLSQQMVDELEGNIALIDRGAVSFDDKFARATAAGAIGVIVANNDEGNAFVMGGQKSFEIPGVMIHKALGDSIKEEIQKGDVTLSFAPTEKFKRPEVIDILAPFSSQGPRDLDALIKPEVTAPGFQIISALIGSGNQGLQIGGTSMAAPHIAGIAALLMQYKSHLTPLQIKALIMNSGLLVDDMEGEIYPISRQGAGRVQADVAILSDLVVSPPALSIGRVNAKLSAVTSKTIELTNTGIVNKSYQLSVQSHPAMTVSLSQTSVTLAPGEVIEVEVNVSIVPEKDLVVELDGFIQVSEANQLVANVPVMAVVNRTTEILMTDLSVDGTEDQSFGVDVKATFENTSEQSGIALLFNLLGKDTRKKSNDEYKSVACDLESAGYRVVDINQEQVLQVAVKLFNPITTWGTCDVNVEFDLNNDNEPDKLVIGANPSKFAGLAALEIPGLVSVLFNSESLSQILAQYSMEVAKQPDQRPSISFLPAVEGISPMLAVEHSTIAIVDVPVANLNNVQDLQLRVSTSFNGRDIIQQEDVLDENASGWKTISTDPMKAGYADIPQVVEIAAQATDSVLLKKGQNSKESLISYFPRNKYILTTFGVDSQSQVRSPEYTKETIQP